MSGKISRRDFLKLAGMGAAATAVLTGCGPAARYVTRKPYTDMPEYNQTGVSTYYATTCRECPAGCGLIVRTQEGRAIKVEGNPNHPVNKGKACSRGLTAVQGLYNPDRLKGPVRHVRGSETNEPLTWDAAIGEVKKALQTAPNQIGFMLGLASDHLYDLVSELTAALGSPKPVRYGALGTFENRSTLISATLDVLRRPSLPYFDIANADVVFSFGANFLETWLSPVAYARGYSQMRRGKFGKRGFLVSFEPRLSSTSAAADMWVPIRPGSEGLVAQAIGHLVAELRGAAIPAAFKAADPEQAAVAADVPLAKLKELAELFAGAKNPLAIPGGVALNYTNGKANAVAILSLNVLANNIGQPGGVYLTSDEQPQHNFGLTKDLIQKMNSGAIKVLFIHGVNPAFELPEAVGFKQALSKVPLVISFSSFPDETAMQSDLVLPDHTGLEAFGYQKVLAGADRPTLSAAQPVVVPLYDTRSSGDVLLEAVRLTGGDLAKNINYTDEVDYLQRRLAPYLERSGGIYTAGEVLTLWSLFLQHGGWWTKAPGLTVPAGVQDKALPAIPVIPTATGKFHLMIFPTQMGDGSGANRPWLQETPDPMTTLMWNTWVEMNPDRAHELGIKDDDIVKIESPYGSIEASVYLYPAIRPDTIAIPFGQGHTELGRYARGRGSNPAKLIGVNVDEADALVLGGVQVTVTATGKRRPLARLESREGVYEQHK